MINAIILFGVLIETLACLIASVGIFAEIRRNEVNLT